MDTTVIDFALRPRPGIVIVVISDLDERPIVGVGSDDAGNCGGETRGPHAGENDAARRQRRTTTANADDRIVESSPRWYN